MSYSLPCNRKNNLFDLLAYPCAALQAAPSVQPPSQLVSLLGNSAAVLSLSASCRRDEAVSEYNSQPAGSARAGARYSVAELLTSRKQWPGTGQSAAARS